MGTALQVLTVASLGALTAALTYAASQYFLFLGQVLRLVGAEELWVDGLLSAGLRDTPIELRPGSIVALATFGVAIQCACGVAAGIAVRRARDLPQRAATAHASPRLPTAVLAWGAIVASTISVCAFVLTELRAVQRAVGLVHAASGAVGHTDRASLLGEGVSNVIETPFWGLVMAVPQFALYGTVVCFASHALQRDAAARRASLLAASHEQAARGWSQVPSATLAALLIGAAALAVAGLLPALAGSMGYFHGLRRGFDELAALEVSQKVPSLIAALDDGRRALARSAVISLAGTVFATALAIFLIVVLPVRRRRRLCDDPTAVNPRVSIMAAVVTAAALLASGALVRVVAPYRAEDAHPIRMVALPEYAFPPETPVPAFTGPDKLAMAPILALTPDRAALDGRPVQPAALGEDLQTLLRNWGILHPGEPPIDTLNLMCGTGTRLAETIPFLREAYARGYVHVRLALGRWHVVHRPVMGKMMRPRFSAAAAELTTTSDAPAASNTDTVILDPQGTCDGLARDLASLRNAGRRARVLLP